MLYRIAKVVMNIYYGLFFRVKTEGIENVPDKGGAILCCNHISNYDPITVALRLNRLPRYISKKELFDNKLFAKVLSTLKAFPVDREKMDFAAIKNCLNVLKEGELLGIFAQGRRVKEGETAAAKAGVALFAVKSGAPVIPVAIKSTYKPFSEIKVIYGEPISFEEYKGKRVTSEELSEIADDIMEKINGMLR